MSEITIMGEKKIKTDINESVDTNIYSGVAEEHKELITKQIVISPSIYEAHLIPVTAPEDDINQIQAHIDKLEKLLKGYLRLTNEVEAYIEELENERKN